MADNDEVITHEDGDLYRVAVVVFTNIRSKEDYTDAELVAARAVARTLRENEVVFRQRRRAYDDSHDLVWAIPVEVAEVMSLDMAAGSGYLRMVPGISAYRSYGHAAGKLPENMTFPYDPADEED